MTDPIERQAAIEAVSHWLYDCDDMRSVDQLLSGLPSAQPEQTACEYCHEDSDGYVLSIEKNSHAYLVRRGKTMKLHICFKGEYRECDILFCPMCGRRLTDG